MKRTAFAAFLAAVLFAVPAAAQSIEGIFAVKGDRVVAKLAHLSFPKAVGTLTAGGSREFSHQGENIDSALQYNSPTGIVATIYVYLPGYPDAGLAAYETDRILPGAYGPAVTILSKGVVPFAGKPNAAIRYIYSGAVVDGKTFATASAFARVGGWIVKMRVSAPAAMQGEVAARLDALIAGTKIEGKARAFPVGVPDFAPPCPPVASGKVNAANDEKGMGGALIAAMGSMPINDAAKRGDNPLPPNFPANGLTKMCVRGSVKVGDGSLAVLQPAGTKKPDAIVVMLADNGNLIAITSDPVGGNYTITKAEIGKLTVAGAIDRMPDNDELARLFSGGVPGALTVRATTTFSADGNSKMSIAMPDKK